MENILTETTEKPNPTLTIVVGDKKHKQFMSFGLLNLLMTYIESPLQIIQLPTDAELTQTLLIECLSTRDADGSVTEQFNLFNLDPEEGEKVLAWMIAHISHFFVQTLSQMPKQLKDLNLAVNTSLQRGQTGSPS